MDPHDCNQVDRLKRIEDDVTNHRSWRADTTAQLSDISVQLATLNERVKNFTGSIDEKIDTRMEPFEKHVEEGGVFRTTLIFTILGFAGSLIIGSIAYGKLMNQVDINTGRWDRLLSEQTHSQLK